MSCFFFWNLYDIENYRRSIMIIMILIRICRHGLKRLNISLILFHTGHNSVTDIKVKKNMNVL